MYELQRHHPPSTFSHCRLSAAQAAPLHLPPSASVDPAPNSQQDITQLL